MKPDGQADQLEVRPSMESFQFLDSVPSSSTEQARLARPPRSDRRQLNRELQMKAEELEKLYAALKLRSARNQLREVQLVESDGDLLLKMVDDLERNMKLSRSEIRKGRSYEKYVEKRDAKLRECLGSKGAQKRMKMKMIENRFEESWAQMKARCRDKAVKSFQNEEDLHEQIQYSQEKSSNDALVSDGSLKRIGSRKLSSTTNVPSTTPQTSATPIPKPFYGHINPDSTRGRTRAINPSAQSLPNFSHLRKENMKPPTRVNKANTPSQSRTCARSKSTTNFGELKDLSSINSYHNSNLASSKFSKEQSQKTTSSKIQVNESKTVLGRRGSGLDTGASRTDAAKLRASKAFEIESKEDESEDMLNQQIYSLDLIKKEDEELERRLTKERASIFHIGSDSEELRSSQESGRCNIKSEKYDILKYVEEAVNGLAVASKFNISLDNVDESPEESTQLFSSNIHRPQSCVHVASSPVNDSVHTPVGSPATWNSLHQNITQEADAARARKKWGIVEKPNLATNNSDQLLKDVAKQVKKLFRFRKKGKSADSTVNILACASSASGGDDDTDDGREAARLSSDYLKKSSNGYVVPAYVGLHEGKIFPERVQSPSRSISTSPANIKVREDHQLEGFAKASCSVFSFLSFHGRGSESRVK